MALNPGNPRPLRKDIIWNYISSHGSTTRDEMLDNLVVKVAGRRLSSSRCDWGYVLDRLLNAPTPSLIETDGVLTCAPSVLGLSGKLMVRQEPHGKAKRLRSENTGADGAASGATRAKTTTEIAEDAWPVVREYEREKNSKDIKQDEDGGLLVLETTAKGENALRVEHPVDGQTAARSGRSEVWLCQPGAFPRPLGKCEAPPAGARKISILTVRAGEAANCSVCDGAVVRRWRHALYFPLMSPLRRRSCTRATRSTSWAT